MKQITNALLILATAVGLIVLPTVKAAHASGCTNLTLTGSYGFMSSGFGAKNAGKGKQYPSALAGVVTFDGAGNFSSAWTSAFDGEIARGLTGSGTYTVNSDCTGTATFTSGDAAGFTFDSVIVSAGAEVFFIETLPGTTATIDLKKQ
jgi:hypothetical protein